MGQATVEATEKHNRKTEIPIYICIFLNGIGIIIASITMAQIVISQWFEKFRGTLMSACIIVLSLVSAVLFPTLQSLLTMFSYRSVALVEGIIAGAIIILVGLFLVSEPPEKYGLKPYGYVDKPVTSPDAGQEKKEKATGASDISLTTGQIIKFPILWCILICCALGTMAAQAFNSQATLFYQSIGVDVIQAAFVLSLFSLLSMPYNLGFGILSDKFGPRVATLICGIMTAAGFTLSFLWMGMTGAVIAAVLIAATGPLAALFGPVMLSRLFGKKESGNLIGWAHAANNVGAVIGPALAGNVFGMTGSYVPAYMILGATMIFLIIVAVIATSKKTAESIRKKAEALAA
jgi:sugar phosphate permease